MQKVLFRFSESRMIQPKAFIIWNTNSILNVQIYKPLYQERKQLVLTQMGNISVEWVPITRSDDKVNVEWNAKKLFTVNPQQYGSIIDLLYNPNKDIRLSYQGKEKLQKIFEIKLQKDGNYIVSLQEERDQFQINATRGDIVNLAELVKFILPYSLGWHCVSQINFQQQQ